MFYFLSCFVLSIHGVFPFFSILNGDNTAASNCSRGESRITQGSTTTISRRLHCSSLWTTRGHSFDDSGPGGGTTAPTLSLLTAQDRKGARLPPPSRFYHSRAWRRQYDPPPSRFGCKRTWEGAQMPPHSRFGCRRTGKGHDRPRPLVFDGSGPGGATTGPTLSLLTAQDRGRGHKCPLTRISAVGGPGGGSTAPSHS
jgi:hypothetical protein